MLKKIHSIPVTPGINREKIFQEIRSQWGDLEDIIVRGETINLVFDNASPVTQSDVDALAAAHDNSSTSDQAVGEKVAEILSNNEGAVYSPENKAYLTVDITTWINGQGAVALDPETATLSELVTAYNALRTATITGLEKLQIVAREQAPRAAAMAELNL
jgi:hypothetical protein